jgi:hypothetical protein
MKMPSIINPVAIAWKTLIDSLRTVAAIMIPNIGVNENTLIVFTIPMRFRPSKNRNSAPPKPKTDIIIMIGSSSVSMYKSVPVDSVTANKISPPNRDFNITIFAELRSALLVRLLLRLLSIAQKNIEAKIRTFPGLYWSKVSDILRSVVAMKRLTITSIIPIFP